MERITFDRKANAEFRRELTVPCKFSITNGLNVGGYFCVYDVVDRVKDVIAPSSMVLPDYDITLQYNHNSDYILARDSNGSLQFSSDAYGIAFQASLVDGQFETDLIKRINAGVINGCSFGLYPLKSHKELRVITAKDAHPSLIGQKLEVMVYDQWLLDEITITGKPAFPQTTLTAFNVENNKGVEGLTEENNDIWIKEAKLRGLLLDD